MKKTLSLLLALSMLALTAVSCGKTDTAETTTTADNTTTATTTTAATEPVETVAPDLQDTLPEVSFGGETFTVLIRESTANELDSKEQTGDLVADAVYGRNATVEERFGVDIEVLTAPGNWGERDAFINRVSNSIMGGDHQFDMVMTHNGYLTMMTLRGLGLDLNELENLDFSKRWWCQKYMENIAIDGKVYAAMGDIGYSLYQYLEAVYFNKKIADENKLPDLYALVQSGEWTFDKMIEFAKLVGSDLNGDGKYNELDLYGLSIDDHNCRYAATIWETGMTTIGADGRRDFNLPNERYINGYEKLYNAIYDNEQVFYSGDQTYDDTKMFVNDQLLFLTDTLGEAAKMREMTSDYGIIPFPKYDAEQANYISATRDSHSGLMVANNIEKPDMVGTVIEALCMYGRSEVTPAYYETTLKLKYVSDETAMSMLDLIRDNVEFDFVVLYNFALGYPYSYYGGSITSKMASISAGIKGQAGAWQKTLDRMYSGFDSLSK